MIEVRIRQDLPTYTRNDAMFGYTFAPAITDSPPGPAVSVRLHFRENKATGALIASYSSEGVNPDIGTISISKFVLASTWFTTARK